MMGRHEHEGVNEGNDKRDSGWYGLLDDAERLRNASMGMMDIERVGLRQTWLANSTRCILLRTDDTHFW